MVLSRELIKISIDSHRISQGIEKRYEKTSAFYITLALTNLLVRCCGDELLNLTLFNQYLAFLIFFSFIKNQTFLFLLFISVLLFTFFSRTNFVSTFLFAIFVFHFLNYYLLPIFIILLLFWFFIWWFFLPPLNDFIFLICKSVMSTQHIKKKTVKNKFDNTNCTETFSTRLLRSLKN